ncbi:M23 family metallopeptidase [Kiloniella sp. EL199]|uniref:M23 family metallopeptidase n=1 Tax=Kiloniella sp. EL199 TaxID=2107581 RepID=UPI0013C473B1|nr:M23 family metallopeptidase [Kiloniella sp. EL199]
MDVHEFARNAKLKIDQVFAQREIHIRSHDQVKFIRLTPRFQKIITTSVLALTSWIAFSSGSLFYTEQRLAQKDTIIEEQKLNYFDLLQQVGEYHTQFSKITKDLQENQDQLISLLDGNEVDTDESTKVVNLKNSENERARVALARQVLEDRLDQFEDDLETIAGQSEALETQAKQLRRVLATSEEERFKSAEAGKMLGSKLLKLQKELEAVTLAKEELETNKVTILANVDALEAKIVSLKGQISEKDELFEEQQAQMASLMEARRVADKSSQEAKDKFIEQVSILEMYREKNVGLESEVDQLQNSLIEVSNIQRELVDRLTERSKYSLGVIEKTVEMTGLNLETLLGSENLDTGQGGPYIPVDEIQESADFEASVNMLDMQLTRWETLQDVVAKLPLTTPIDQYRITSSFGKRRDPVTGKTSVHNGLDMAAPMKSSVYAPAPGKIVYAGWRGRYGRLVEIDHGNGIRTRYGHLRKLLVKQGQEVSHREKIALLGNSGRSTGPHVHYEVLYNNKPVDPRKFILAGRHVFKVQ